MGNNFLQQMVMDALQGKYAAIHAYDRMIWMVRSGFLTLIFLAWSFLLKTGIEHSRTLWSMSEYVVVLSLLSLVLAYGAYRIDLNYVKRKFRVVASVNEIKTIVIQSGAEPFTNEQTERLRELLKIAGDAANNSYELAGYHNEQLVSRIIYGLPSALVVFILLRFIL